MPAVLGRAPVLLCRTARGVVVLPRDVVVLPRDVVVLPGDVVVLVVERCPVRHVDDPLRAARV